eukprot:jgi/Ulvmu1/6425/UM003_0054.1
MMLMQGDAIVNAANERMLGGAGVDGAVHDAAGPDLLAACEKVPSSRGIRCPTGEARITPGFNLPARFVIHTVGPIYYEDRTSQPWLEMAYRNTLKLANDPKYGISSIGFPAISCGAYGYPIGSAAQVALQTCQLHAGGLSDITFVLFSQATAEPFLACAESFLREEIKQDVENDDRGSSK